MPQMVWKPAARSRVYVVSGRHLYPGTVRGYSTHRKTGEESVDVILDDGMWVRLPVDEPYLTVD